MLGSAIIEVIIGLVFVYILLSLLVAQVNQIIANMLKLRARTLRRRLQVIIFDETIERKVMSHPLVGILRPPTENRSDQETSPVANLPAGTFAKALINILSDPYLDFYAALTEVENKEERDQLRAIVNQLKANMGDPARSNAVVNRLHESILALEPDNREDRQLLLKTLGPLQWAVRDIQSGNSGLLQVLNGVSQVENRAFQQAMESVLSGVQTLNEAEEAIENWYDNKMAQTRDMYTRIMQYLSLIIGLVIALMLNIDSLYLARTLWVDSSLRDQLTIAANAALVQQERSSTTTIVVPSRQGEGDATVEQIAQNFEEANAILSQLLELNLPIGWTFRPPQSVPVVAQTAGGLSSRYYDPLEDSRNLYNLVPFVTGDWLWNLIIKLAGLGVTAFAVAQGAPFWFDILRRIAGQKSASNETPQSGEMRGQSS